MLNMMMKILSGRRIAGRREEVCRFIQGWFSQNTQISVHKIDIKIFIGFVPACNAQRHAEHKWHDFRMISNFPKYSQNILIWS